MHFGYLYIDGNDYLTTFKVIIIIIIVIITGLIIIIMGVATIVLYTALYFDLALSFIFTTSGLNMCFLWLCYPACVLLWHLLVPSMF